MKEFADLDGLRSEIKYSYETVRYWQKENKNLQAQRCTGGICEHT
jgi:hypothetical protein